MIRGKLIVTPIENSFLYIVPVYLTAQGTKFPQLKRVIAVAGDKVVMEPTLDEATNDLFGTQQPREPPEGSSQPPTTPQPALEQARAQLDQARKAMQQGDWAKIWNVAMEGLEHQLARAGGTVRVGTPGSYSKPHNAEMFAEMGHDVSLIEGRRGRCGDGRR